MTTSSDEHSQGQHHVPLAIIGLGCLFPDAQDHRGFWANIAGGIDSVGDIPETHWPHADYFDADPKAPDRTYARKGAFLSAVDFDPREFGIPPTTLEATDTAQLLGLVAAKQALMDAGYGEAGSFDRERVSVMLGVTGALELVIPLGARLGHPLWQKAMADCGVDPTTAERISDSISDGMVGWQEASFPGLLGNVVAGRIANRLDLRGTNCVVDAACASSLSALHLAGLELSAGRADMVVSGGIDTFNDIFMYMCFSKTPALSPSGHARPFDASADGTTLGEGLGIVVLKRLDDARRDGNRIYAVIKGLGSSSDGRGTAIYSPSVDGQTRCLRTAYQHAEVDPASVELVEAHGTGTKVGDAIELEALTEVFGSCRESGSWCAVGSVKSQIGHTKAAAGAAGIIKAALALHHKVLPPTIKIEAPAPLLASKDTPFYANTVKRPWLPSADHPRRAAVSSFGFGGSNFHCVLEEQGNERPGIVWDRNLDLVALSARTREDLTTALDAWPEDADWPRLRTLAARSRSSFDLQHAVRLVVVREKQRPTAALASARRMLDQQPERRWWSTPEGAWFGSGERAGKLAFLFPGQGSQKVGMLRELACAFPQALAALAEANEAFADGDTLEHGERLSDHIYPVPSFDDDARRDQDLRLRSTDIAQPALGAVAVAACRVLEHFGVKPDAVSGHSYGELPALWAAGRIDTASLHRLSRLRGRLMAAGDGDRGSMLAVAAPLAEVERLLADKDLDLVIANRNAPEQAVISGASDLIAKAAEACEAQGLSATRLPVAAAFHSPLVAAAREPFATALASVAMAPARLAVYANATADRYPEDASLARDLLADQLTRPVKFVGQIEKLYEDGVRCFVEVGPGARLSGLTRAILAEREHTTVAMDASSGRREGLGDLTRVIAALTALGHGIDLTRWAAGERTGSDDEAGKRPGLRVPIRGANYRAPRPQSPPRPPMQTQIETPQPRVRYEDPAPMAPHAPAGPQDIPAQAPAASPATAPLPAAAPTNTAIPATAAPGLLATAPAALHQALMVTQQTMTALQQLHERSADLHRRFLEGQEAAHRGMAAVAEQQQQLMLAALGAPLAPVALTSAPSLTAPAPATPPPATPPVAVVPAVEPAATPVAPAIDQAEPATDIEPAVLEVVAEKTGYPTDMLEPQMALEADLGIDSIKRVEILSALQDRFPGAPAVRSDQLGSLHTLADITDVLSQLLGTATPAASEPHPQDAPAANASASLHRLIPVATPLRNESSREPITLAQGGEVWISDDGTALTNHLEEALKERKLSVRRLPRDGWETLKTPDSLSGLIILSPANGSEHRFIEQAFSLLHDCAPAFRAAGANGSASLLTVSRLDGSFGLTGLAPEAIPESGGLAGLAKTAGLEWPEVHAKAMDLDIHHADLQAAAAAIVDELLTTGPAEVGLRADGSRSIVGLEIRPLAPESGANPIAQGDLVVVSGGARGVTAQTALALAEAFGPTLLLLGRSPTPQAEPAALKDLSDPREIKQALLKLAQAKLSPRQLEERFSAFMAAREIRDTLAKIEATGARALYRSLDIRDADAVRATLAQIQSDHGPVRGLVHGAGVLADRLIEEQTPEQFRDVYETKVAGLRALLEAIDPEALKVLALFSSTTARFGRRGQVAYAAANEVLNKLAWRLDGKLDGCRVVSLGWGPWDGGMVTPSLATLFAAEGVALIAPEAGGRHLVAELATPRADGGEVLVLGGPLPEATASGLTHTAPNDTDLSLCFERDLDVAHHPVLRDHVLDGRAVLPAALMLEWLAHGALHGQPGLSFCGFDSFRVLRGVVLASSQPVRIRVLAGPPNRQGDQVTIPVELHSRNADGNEVIHARAQVLLANALPDAESPMAPPDLQPYTDDITTMYTRHLFHGPALQGIEAVEGCSQDGIVGQVRAAPAPARWLDQPLRSTWLTDPMAIDGVFQLLILWSQNQHGAASLPCSVKRYRQYSARFPATGTRIVARIMEDGQQRAVSNVDILDGDGELVARLEGYECVVEPSLQRAFRRNQLDEGVLT